MDSLEKKKDAARKMFELIMSGNEIAFGESGIDVLMSQLAWIAKANSEEVKRRMLQMQQEEE